MEASRNLRRSLRCTELKFRKIARHLRRLNLNLRGPLPPDSILQLDELETHERRQSTRPLSVPVVIERDTRYVTWAEAAPIRPRGKKTPARCKAIARNEARWGKRLDTSRRSVGRCLERAAELMRSHPRVWLQTDPKATYPGLAARTFGAERLRHSTTPGTLARGTWNPLFPINHHEAMARHLTGRLRRQSWLASKKRRYLDLAPQSYASYPNLARRRFNRDGKARRSSWASPGREQDLLSWRRDWGRRSLPVPGTCTA